MGEIDGEGGAVGETLLHGASVPRARQASQRRDHEIRRPVTRHGAIDVAAHVVVVAQVHAPQVHPARVALQVVPLLHTPTHTPWRVVSGGRPLRVFLGFGRRMVVPSCLSAARGSGRSPPLRAAPVCVLRANHRHKTAVKREVRVFELRGREGGLTAAVRSVEGVQQCGPYAVCAVRQQHQTPKLGSHGLAVTRHRTQAPPRCATLPLSVYCQRCVSTCAVRGAFP